MTGSPVRFRSPAPFPGRPAGTCGRTSRPETATPRPFGGRGGSAATRSDSTETGSFENRPSRGSDGERLGRSRDRGPDPDPGRRAPGRGAHASFLDPGPVVVGRDTRPSGEWVLRLTEAALLASGHD